MDNVQNVKELRAIATMMLNMVSGNKSNDNKSNEALGAVYGSIMDLSHKMQDADVAAHRANK